MSGIRLLGQCCTVYSLCGVKACHWRSRCLVVDGAVSQLEGRRTNYTRASRDVGWAGARANGYGQSESGEVSLAQQLLAGMRLARISALKLRVETIGLSTLSRFDVLLKVKEKQPKSHSEY